MMTVLKFRNDDKTLALIGEVVIVGVLVFATIAGDDAEIKARLAERGLELVESDSRFAAIGPYYYRGKHQRIYRVVAKRPDGKQQVLWCNRTACQNEADPRLVVLIPIPGDIKAKEKDMETKTDYRIVAGMLNPPTPQEDLEREDRAQKAANAGELPEFDLAE